METKEYLEYYNKQNEIIRHYQRALFVMYFDTRTDCPKEARDEAYVAENYFQEKMVELSRDPKYQEAITYLYEHRDELDELNQKIFEEEHEEMERMNKIPKEELFKSFEISSKCAKTWEDGRITLDYAPFEANMADLVEYWKKMCVWFGPKGNEPFDAILDQFEKGFTLKKYDEFFDLIKAEIVPLAKKIFGKTLAYNPRLDTQKYSISGQKELTRRVCDMMGYTNQKGCVRETIHPFTSGFSSHDVRITTQYQEELVLSNLYSVMHETGHALYELGQDEKLNGTCLFGGASAGMHESQSRFMENYLGRSLAFSKKLLTILKEIFPEEFEGITAEDIYLYANKVTRDFRRTEADELTYPIHILIRYEVEKKLFRGEITAYQVSDTFDDLFEEYFGVRPANKLEGAFQDVHWSEFYGYFPTYALGNAYAAQFMESMKKELDLDALMEEGNFAPINKWLDDKIHQYGKFKDPEWLIRNSCEGNDFDPHYYINYLKDKFTKLYNL